LLLISKIKAMSEESGGCLLWVLFVALLLIFNPSEEKHKKAVINAVNEFCAKNSTSSVEALLLCNSFGQEVVKIAANEIVKRENWYVCSLTKLSFNGEEKIIGVGALGFVYIFGDLGETSKKDENQ